MRYSKYIVLGVGAPLVLVGSRLLTEGLSLHLPLVILILALPIFFVGRSMVRFEDFPQGKDTMNKMDARLESRKEMFRYVTSPLKKTVQPPKVINETVVR